MVSRRSPLRIRLAMVLACALAHQWGACPCGCPEHNRWLQTVQQWTSIAVDAPAPIREELVIPGDVCDHLPLAALHRAEERHEDRWADALTGAPTTLSLGIPCALAVSASPSGARQACSLRQCSPSGAARQAWLQVFLI